MTRICTGFPLVLLAIAACAPRNIPSAPVYDVVIRGGTIYDGLGGKPYVGGGRREADRHWSPYRRSHASAL